MDRYQPAFNAAIGPTLHMEMHAVSLVDPVTIHPASVPIVTVTVILSADQDGQRRM